MAVVKACRFHPRVSAVVGGVAYTQVARYLKELVASFLIFKAPHMPSQTRSLLPLQDAIARGPPQAWANEGLGTHPLAVLQTLLGDSCSAFPEAKDDGLAPFDEALQDRLGRDVVGGILLGLGGEGHSLHSHKTHMRLRE